jgi:hypothetical protein
VRIYFSETVILKCCLLEASVTKWNLIVESEVENEGEGDGKHPDSYIKTI